MPSRPMAAALLAPKLTWALDRLWDVDSQLCELGYVSLSTKLIQLETELIEVRAELLDLLPNPPALPQPHKPAGRVGQDELPF